MSAQTVPTVWSVDEENFIYDCLAELLGTHEEKMIGDVVYVGDLVTLNPHRFCDADDIIELMGERAYDECGEWAEDYPNVTKEQKAELAALLQAWQTKYCQPSFWMARNVKPHTLTAEDFAECGYGEQP